MDCFLCSPFVFVCLIFVGYVVKILLNRKCPSPPGPRGYPIFGNMALMNQLSHRGLADLSKKYGGLLHLQMGRIHIVAVSTADMAREILQVQDVVFANRPANVAITYLTYDRADMAFANYGPLWRQMRKICVMKLFSRKRAESWASVREEIGSMIQSITEQAGSPVNVGELVFALTRNITYRAAFGSFARDGQDEFMKILQEFSKLFGAFDMAEFLPWLGWLYPRDFVKRLEKARGSLDSFIDNIIDEHMEKKRTRDINDDDGNDDMVDELMAFYSEEHEQKGVKHDDSQSLLRLTRDNIKALVMDVMFGGTETVASAIEWAMAELMKSPKELKRVQQELTDVIGLNRPFNESDLENLPYFRCAMKETLRMHPPIPLLLHETSADTVVSGYGIPKDSRVMINVWAIGRDGSVWPDPDEFRPGRFLDSNSPDFKGSDFQFLPFGSGRRSCPGMQLGLYALELAVAHMLHSFDWELPDGVSSGDLDMTDMFGLTAPKAVRLVAVPSYRLTCPPNQI
ncbi:PREDICTED: cytochrome P450 84A1-like [Tarenaya hassleriana]|uniref:cytochrome P450 84A1-like n=1 Tax=Tarenaya hassleriana TaxID=28532 RepID=UPI00053C7BB8|nr:PREDICTED: cytochrome P450 84A1-like [Tarenaya hassleriana]